MLLSTFIDKRRSSGAIGVSRVATWGDGATKAALDAVRCIVPTEDRRRTKALVLSIVCAVASNSSEPSNIGFNIGGGPRGTTTEDAPLSVMLVGRFGGKERGTKQ